MKFNEFVDKFGFSYAFLADQFDVSPLTISRIYSGEVYPRPPLQRKIVEWTNNLVSANELIGLPRVFEKEFNLESKLKKISIRSKK